jgi:hypothetical protein
MRSKEIENYKARLKLSAEQKEILIGILLGDATLQSQNKGRTYRLMIEHSIKQRAYVEHLYHNFKEWVLTPPSLKKVVRFEGKLYTTLLFSTLSTRSLRFYAHQFYKDNHKMVPRLIERWLTPKALAYWFMDDGSIKSKESKGAILNTQGYFKEEVVRLVKVLKKRFDLQAKLRRQKEGYQIYISGKSYETLRNLIFPFILPEMRYKFPEARRTHLSKE